VVRDIHWTSTLTLTLGKEDDLQNLLNLEKKLQEMRDQIEGLNLGLEVAEDSSAFWEKKSKGLEVEMKATMFKLSRLASVEQELEMYKSKVGELAK